MICPTCRKPARQDENPYIPFCSERCKTIDLGKWASDAYRVPGERISPEEAEIGEHLARPDDEDD